MPDLSVSTSVDAATLDTSLFIPEWTYNTLTPSDVHDLVESLYGTTRTKYTLDRSTLDDTSIVETYKERLAAQLTHNGLTPSDLEDFTPRHNLTCTYVAASETAQILSGDTNMLDKVQRSAIWSKHLLLEKSTRHRHFQERLDRWMGNWNAYEIKQDILMRTVPESVASVGKVNGSREFVDLGGRRFRY